MRVGRAVGVVTLLVVLSAAACTSGTASPSRVLSATGIPTPTLAPATPSATPSFVIAITQAPAATTSPTPAQAAWTGTMSSSSNYTVTAQGGGLVCSATWTTFLAFDIGPDSHVDGKASTDLVGTPVCTHPEYFTTPVTIMSSSITGTLSSNQLQLQFNQISYDPASSFDATGMSASIYGINTAPPTITIPRSAPGHAAGSQQLQTVTGSNSYTSDNTLTLDCPTC